VLKITTVLVEPYASIVAGVTKKTNLTEADLEGYCPGLLRLV